MIGKVFKRWGKVALVLILGLVALFFALALFSDPEPPGKKNVTVQTIPDPEAVGENYSVTVKDIPSTFAERRNAPAAALLPVRAGYPEARPATVDSKTKEEILAATEAWLEKWETFRPGEIEAGRYKKRIIGLATKDALPRLLGREDASDPPSVGPEGPSRLASRWVNMPGFNQSAFIIDYLPGEAYVVAYGAVRYAGELADPLTGSSRERSYGILLQKRGGRWLVERSAGEGIR